jgi:hypothetical protein
VFLLIFVDSTLLFSRAPVSESHDAVSFRGGGPLSTELIVRWIRFALAKQDQMAPLFVIPRLFLFCWTGKLWQTGSERD